MSNPSNISAFASVAALRALWPLPAGTSSAFVQGESVNGVQGVFDWVAGSSATDNSGIGGAGVGCVKPTANSGSGRWITSISTPQQLSFRFSTFAAAQATTIPSAITEVILGGYYAEGDCSPAKYKQVGSQPTHNGGKFQSANGIWFQYVPDSRGANACAFAAKADGIVSGTYTYSGTDNAAAIQNCIDFATYFAFCKAYVPAGIYLTNDTIQAGYGIATETVNLEGDGKRYRAGSSFSGTAILCNFSDRPGIAISGARGTRVNGIEWMGTNFNWIQSNNMLAPVPSVDDTVLTNWIDPGLNANANSRYAPYAAIAIDPYMGSQPTPHYPNVTFPAWAGSPGQYGKLASSAVQIENCAFSGFVHVLAIQPCNADANGDFIKLTDCRAQYNVYSISAGNGQGRQFTAEKCSFAQCHTQISNTVIGLQRGQLDLTSIGTDWEQCIQILGGIDSTSSGPFNFLNSYSESIWKIGQWGTGGSTCQSLTFKSHKFSFGAQNDYRGYPPYTLQFSAPAPIDFSGCVLAHTFGKMFSFSGSAGCLSFNNNSTITPARTAIYEKISHSFLGGSLMFAPSTSDPNFPLAFANSDSHGYDASGASLGPMTYSRYSLSNRNNPICAWLAQARPNLQLEYILNVPPIWAAYSKVSKFSSISLSGTTLTAVFNTLSDTLAYYHGGLPGDIIYDDNSGSVFYIRSRTTTTVVAELQNNYKIVGGTFDANGMSTGGGTVTPINAFSTTVGNLYFGNSRIFLPEYFLRGDISTASPVISNAARDDGSSLWIDGDNQVLIGDYLYINDQLDRFFSQANTPVTSVSGAGSTITLSGNGARTETIHPLGFFIRQPPANV